VPDFGRWTSSGGDPSLNEINRTDRFLDSLANQEPVYSTDPSEAELAQLFAGWRDEVRTPPLMAPVTPRDAMVALTRAVESRKRTRTSMALVGSVAAAVLCLGGFGAVVAGAGPGDPLYGLHTMLFGEQQQPPRTDQVTLASQQLAEVQQLIDEGQWQAAQDKLQAITTTVATVNDVEQKEQLVDQWQELTVKVDAKDANATLPPGAPAPEMPVPVVIPPASDTSTSASSETGSSTTSSSTSSSETTTSSSETTTSTTTSSPTSSSPLPEPPPPTSVPATTTTPPTTTAPTTTTTTTTRAVTTTTTTPPQAAVPPDTGGEVVVPPAVVAPPAEVAPPTVVAPPTTVVPEAPKQRGPQSPVVESEATENIPVTTTTLEMPPPKKRGDGE
jgi:hypothetical protein